jgi:CRP-like cAMP-binding protein
VWLGDPVGVFWESALLVVNVGQLVLRRVEDSRARFSPEDLDFVNDALPDLPPSSRRRLLDLGVWVTGEPGAVLTREGDNVQHLIYLATGEATIRMAGVDVATCPAGAFVGEVTVMQHEPATATAILTRPSRYWAIDARVLRQATQDDPELRRALSTTFSRHFRDKLIRTNRRLADGWSPRSPPSEEAGTPSTAGGSAS